jgi:hypothetical protein
MKFAISNSIVIITLLQIFYSGQWILLCHSPEVSNTIFILLEHFVYFLVRVRVTFTANQFVLTPNPLKLTTRDFIGNWTLAVIVLMSHPH